MILLSALWLGILTSISPCPLATNIAAVSFLSKRINHPKTVFAFGMAYTLGRMLTYAILGVAIIMSLVSVPSIASFFQEYMNKILGPLLIIVGLFLLDIIRINIAGLSISQEKQQSLVDYGIGGAFALGVIFSLSFCPVSAALFFGSLIPLALNSRLGIVLPFLYGLGTGLPVIILALGIALGVTKASFWFKKMSAFERYTKKITGVIFILVGLYYIWAYIISALIV
ncbi:MAG: sulfite exporter TauE/SafE family protein [Candidatus Omnitrophica bacterium]|nr:sulfite exporter TauE/SafE family protein [Candidatus Omnitrophota bacterium]